MIEDLKERVIADQDNIEDDHWYRQYLDHDHKSNNGETLNEVNTRMRKAIDTILSQMKIVILTYATALCCYLLNFCSITVTNPINKSRLITFEKKGHPKWSY